MKKRILVLLIFLMLTPFSSAWATSGFKDTAGQWWEQPIAECNSANLMVGRAAGIFAPKESVTQMEAIILLNRAMGYRSEADNYSMSQGGYNFPSDFPEWGKKNVAFAADKGYITKANISKIQPKKAATRVEIAVLYANALNLSADGYQLNFTDNAAIHSSLQPFVAAAVKHDVMVGKMGNKFDPNANVTRGEIAVIIARLFENGKISPQPDKYYIAKVSSVDVANKKISVIKEGQTLTLSLANSSELYRSGNKGAFSAFKANENVKVVLDSAGKVTFLANTTASATTINPPVTPVQSTIHGTVRGLLAGNPFRLSFQPDTGSLTSYSLSSSVVITQDGNNKDLTSLTTGTKAELKLTNGSVVEIKLISTISGNELKGHIVNLYLDYLTVRYDNGTSEQIDRTTIGAGYYSFTKGQRIALYKTGNRVTSISPLNEPRKFFGEVVNINSTRITYEDSDGYERTLDFANSFSVKDKNGRTANLSDVKVEDDVQLEVNSSDKIVELTMLGAGGSDLEGEVTYIKTSGSMRIELKGTGSNAKTYYVDDDVDVYKGNSSKTMSYINKGDYVKLKLNRDGDVIRIDILDYSLLEGEVTYIKTSGTLKLKVKSSNGTEKQYDVDDDVEVFYGSSSRNFDRVKSGDFVKVRLDSDNYVIRVDILDYTLVEGEVTSIRTSGSLRIKVKQTNGTEKLYDVEDDVEVFSGTTSRNFDRVKVGDFVKVRLDTDQYVVRVDILDSKIVEGEVTYIRTTSGSYRIKVEDSGGNIKDYYVLDDVKVWDSSNRSRNFNYIEIEDMVKIKINSDSKVYEVNII